MINDFNGYTLFLAGFEGEGTGLVRRSNLSSSMDALSALLSLSHALESGKNACEMQKVRLS